MDADVRCQENIITNRGNDMKTKEQIQDRLVAEIEAYAMADDQAQRDCIERAISTLQWALQG